MFSESSYSGTLNDFAESFLAGQGEWLMISLGECQRNEFDIDEAKIYWWAKETKATSFLFLDLRTRRPQF